MTSYRILKELSTSIEHMTSYCILRDFMIYYIMTSNKNMTSEENLWRLSNIRRHTLCKENLWRLSKIWRHIVYKELMASIELMTSYCIEGEFMTFIEIMTPYRISRRNYNVRFYFNVFISYCEGNSWYHILPNLRITAYLKKNLNGKLIMWCCCFCESCDVSCIVKALM